MQATNQPLKTATMLDLENKTILVSIRRIDVDGTETFDTFFGCVLDYSEKNVKVSKPDGTEINMPYEEEVYQAAERGFYTLKDGSTHDNPDFIAQWTVYKNDPTAEKYRQPSP